MVLFEDEVIKSWKPAEKPQEKKGGKGKDHGKKGKEGKKEKEEKEEKKPEKAEEDDMDLFGEETEEEKKVPIIKAIVFQNHYQIQIRSTKKMIM